MTESTVKDNRTLEELFQELDGMMRQMEEPGLSLEQSFSLYHRGIELLKSCNEQDRYSGKTDTDIRRKWRMP